MPKLILLLSLAFLLPVFVISLLQWYIILTREPLDDCEAYLTLEYPFLSAEKKIDEFLKGLDYEGL